MKTTLRKALFNHSVIEYKNGVVRKLIEPGFTFLPAEQESLLLDIYTFRAKLQMLGIPVAAHYNLTLDQGKILEETQNCGMDGYLLLQSSTTEQATKKILRKIVKAFLPVFLEKEISVVPDPHPANWCFDVKGNVRYIDFQPPRFLKTDGTRLVGFPQPVGHEYRWSVNRYYTRFSLFRILRFNVMRAIGLSGEEILKQVIKSECPDTLFREFNDGIQTLLEQRVRNRSISFERALEGCDQWCVDDIRELAMFTSTTSTGNKKDILSSTLSLTRVDFNLPFEERRIRIQEVKNSILRYYKGIEDNPES